MATFLYTLAWHRLYTIYQIYTYGGARAYFSRDGQYTWGAFLLCLKTCTPLILYAVTENEVKTGALDLHYRPWCVFEAFRMSGATFSYIVRKPVRTLMLSPSIRSIGSAQVLQRSVYFISIIAKNRDFFLSSYSQGSLVRELAIMEFKVLSPLWA